MIDVIRGLGLTGSLQLCLDAGDIASYAGTGQTVIDVSGTGTNFIFGDSVSDATNDPTYVGIAGAQSSGEYFRGAASTVTRLVATKGAWSDVHKDNAVFTYAEWQWVSGNGQSCFNTAADSTSIGVVFGSATGLSSIPAGSLGFIMWNGGGTDQEIHTAATVPTGQWSFLAVAFTEGSSSTLQINGTQETKSLTYSSPSGSPSTRDFFVPPSTSSIAAEGRVNSAAFWTRQLSAAELLSIYNLTKSKFGL